MEPGPDAEALSEELIARVEAVVDARVRARVDEHVRSSAFRKSASEAAARSRLRERLLVGPPERVVIHPTAKVKSVMLNTSSGRIVIEEFVGIAHNVALLTGLHNVDKFRQDRFDAVPVEGRDIFVRAGAWIATGATVIGPCVIGEDAVVAAGAVVTRDVPPRTIVSGNPAVPTGGVGPGTRRAMRSGGRYRATPRAGQAAPPPGQAAPLPDQAAPPPGQAAPLPDQAAPPPSDEADLEDLLAMADEPTVLTAVRGRLSGFTQSRSLVELDRGGRTRRRPALARRAP